MGVGRSARIDAVGRSAVKLSYVILGVISCPWAAITGWDGVTFEVTFNDHQSTGDQGERVLGGLGECGPWWW